MVCYSIQKKMFRSQFHNCLLIIDDFDYAEQAIDMETMERKIQVGDQLILRNAHINMVNNCMRVAVDQWGWIEMIENKNKDFPICIEKNLSLVPDCFGTRKKWTFPNEEPPEWNAGKYTGVFESFKTAEGYGLILCDHFSDPIYVEQSQIDYRLEINQAVREKQKLKFQVFMDDPPTGSPAPPRAANVRSNEKIYSKGRRRGGY